MPGTGVGGGGVRGDGGPARPRRHPPPPPACPRALTDLLLLVLGLEAHDLQVAAAGDVGHDGGDAAPHAQQGPAQHVVVAQPQPLRAVLALLHQPAGAVPAPRGGGGAQTRSAAAHPPSPRQPGSRPRRPHLSVRLPGRGGARPGPTLALTRPRGCSASARSCSCFPSAPWPPPPSPGGPRPREPRARAGRPRAPQCRAPPPVQGRPQPAPRPLGPARTRRNFRHRLSYVSSWLCRPTLGLYTVKCFPRFCSARRQLGFPRTWAGGPVRPRSGPPPPPSLPPNPILPMGTCVPPRRPPSRGRSRHGCPSAPTTWHKPHPT